MYLVLLFILCRNITHRCVVHFRARSFSPQSESIRTFLNIHDTYFRLIFGCLPFARHFLFYSHLFCNLIFLRLCLRHFVPGCCALHGVQSKQGRCVFWVVIFFTFFNSFTECFLFFCSHNRRFVSHLITGTPLKSSTILQSLCDVSSFPSFFSWWCWSEKRFFVKWVDSKWPICKQIKLCFLAANLVLPKSTLVHLKLVDFFNNFALRSLSSTLRLRATFVTGNDYFLIRYFL